MPSVPRLWPGSTIVCLASGPSLTADDVAFVRDKAKAIVINTTYQMAPWADVLYAADAQWWSWHKGVPDFGGLKYSLDTGAARWKGVEVLKITGSRGLEASPSGLKTGRESGYQAIGLAVHLGARRIVLLGYDMQRGPKGEEHWHAPHKHHKRNEFSSYLPYYETLVEPLNARNIEVINATRRSALTAFPRMTIQDALRAREVAA